MRFFVLMLLFFITNSTVMAIPDYLKDGEIIVKLKNGSVQRFSTNEYKIVKRPPPGFVPKECVQKPCKPEIVEKPVFVCRRNGLTLHLGKGYDGMVYSEDEKGAMIMRNETIVGGLSYTFRFATCRWEVTSTALSNETYTLGLGFNF